MKKNFDRQWSSERPFATLRKHDDRLRDIGLKLDSSSYGYS